MPTEGSTKLKDFMGWTILVTEAGEFIGYLPDPRYGRHLQEIKRRDLKVLEREIARRATGKIEVMRWADPATARTAGCSASIPQSPPSKITIVAIESDGRGRTDHGALLSLRGLTRYDGSVVDIIQEFISRRADALQRLDDEYNDWCAGLDCPFLTNSEIQDAIAEPQERKE